MKTTSDFVFIEYEAPRVCSTLVMTASPILDASFSIEPIGDEEYDLFSSDSSTSSFTL